MFRSRDDQLARIYARGDALRSRRRLRAGAGGAAVVVLGLAGAMVVLDDDTAPLVTVGAGVEIPATSVSPDDPLPITTASPPAVCRNSTDPACGDFFYDWPVPNRPLTVSVTVSPEQPRVGETVTFTVVIDDPDGQPISWTHSRIFDLAGVDPVSEEDVTTGDFGATIHGDGVPPGYGPWDPPPPWHEERSYTTTYEGSGQRTFQYMTNQTGRCGSQGDVDCPEVTAELAITVVP